jgi:hypothetical protein
MRRGRALGLVQGDDRPLVAQIEGFESFVERNHERLYAALCLVCHRAARRA